MRKALKITAWIIGVLLLALIAAFAWGRLRPPTSAQAEALKLLQPISMPAGSNAWATLQPEANAPALSVEEGQLLCEWRDEDCLAKVRAQAVPLRALMAKQAGRLAHLQQLNADAVMWDDQPPSLTEPVPQFGTAMKLLLTAPALDFVDGKQAQALQTICTQAATVRRLHAHTNSLLGSMVGVVWMDGIERELAGMLASLPADQAIPDACTQAFAPVAVADVNLCASLQREFAQGATVGPMLFESPKLGWYTRLRLHVLFSNAGMLRLVASNYAWACKPDVQAAALADRSLGSDTVPALRYDIFDRLSNAMGLILARVSAPAYVQYQVRNEDYAAGLRLTAWLLRTRGKATTPADWRQQLAHALPALQQQGDRDFRIEADGRHVRMAYRAMRKDHTAQVLPLGP